MDMDVSQTQQNIQEALSGGNSCAICIEKIRHTDSVSGTFLLRKEHILLESSTFYWKVVIFFEPHFC